MPRCAYCGHENESDAEALKCPQCGNYYSEEGLRKAVGFVVQFEAQPVAVTVADLEEGARRSELIAEFGKPAAGFSKARFGYSIARDLAATCLRWIWMQWLLGTPMAKISEKVSGVIQRGMEFQKRVANEEKRGCHVLYLLNCALCAGTAEEILEVANYVCEASGEERNDGELHYRAWCGALKYELLGQKEKSLAQYRHLEGSRCPQHGRTANRSFLHKALKGKWDDFVELQKKDFERRWRQAFRNGIVRRESTDPLRPIVHIASLPIEQFWCWSQAGLAMLGHRRGVAVATDPLWFPAHALELKV